MSKTYPFFFTETSKNMENFSNAIQNAQITPHSYYSESAYAYSISNKNDTNTYNQTFKNSPLIQT